MIRYISLFSGIEAASCAWEPLGWEPVAFSEIEPFPCAVLAERFPDVPNLGDITEIDWKEVLEKYGEVDLIVGGSPCQSFSVAGKREGLSGESRLMFEYIRAVQEVRPRWFVWENVPGALTSEGGAAFGQLLREMDGLGYGVAWRVLDSRFFGVPQRRRRVFAVGRLGDIEDPCQVLFEPEMLRWDAPSGNKRWEELSSHARGGAGREASVGLIANKGAVSRSSGAEEEVSPTVLADSHQPATAFPWNAAGKAAGFGAAEELSPTLRATICGEPAVCVQGTIANGKRMGQNGLGASEGACYTLDTMDVHGVCYSITPGISNTTRGSGVYEDAAPTLRAVANSNTPAVCYAQNQRYEVRQSGDGTTCGAIPASQSGKQFDFVCLPTIQYGEDIAGTLLARNDGSPCDNKGPNVVCVASTQANAERSDDCSPCLTSHLAKDPSVVCMADDNAHSAVDKDVCGTLKVGGGALCCLPSNGEGWVGTLCARDSKRIGSQFAREGKVIAVSDENAPWFEGEPRPDFEYHLRRLTPTECMRLQGFPDGWCDIEFRGKPATDTPKYKAAGNSMTVNVMRWIGLRIEEVELWNFAT